VIKSRILKTEDMPHACQSGRLLTKFLSGNPKGYSGVDMRIILKLVLEEKCVLGWIGFNWLMMIPMACFLELGNELFELHNSRKRLGQLCNYRFSRTIFFQGVS
jgi:hypothetical protein